MPQFPFESADRIVEFNINEKAERVHVFGEEQSIPLFLINCLPNVWWGDFKLAHSLKKHFKVYYPENIGSSIREEESTFSKISEKMLMIIKSCIPNQRVFIMGGGLGGIIAYYLGSKHPETILGVYAISAPHPDIQELDPNLLKGISNNYNYVSPFLKTDSSKIDYHSLIKNLTQIYESESWWKCLGSFYLKELENEEILSSIKKIAVANFHISRANEQEFVLPKTQSNPVLVKVPTLYEYSSALESKLGISPDVHSIHLLEKFIPQIEVIRTECADIDLQMTCSEEIAQRAFIFHQDILDHLPFSKEEAVHDPQDYKEDRFTAEKYEEKVDQYRCPSIGGKEHALRGAHSKSHGVVHATLFVVPDLDENLQVGLFAKPGEKFPVLLRFSNSGRATFEVHPDNLPDVRGLAIKVLSENDSKDSRIKFTQDFILINNPTLPFGRVSDFIPGVAGAKDIYEAVLMNVKEAVIDNPLNTQYYSQTPYRFGSTHAVKYSIIAKKLPASAEVARKKIDKTDPDFLRKSLTETLESAAEDTILDFMIQFQNDPISEPIEEPWIEWKTPFIKLAEIHIPPQKVLAHMEDLTQEELSFNVGNSLPEHFPLGRVNRARRVIYKASADLRHKINRDAESILQCPFQNKKMSICILGSGGSALSAAYALSKFGHKVTVVEKTDIFGGHAISVEHGNNRSNDPGFGAFTASLYPNFFKILQNLNIEIEDICPIRYALPCFTLDGKYAWKCVEDIPYAHHIFDEIKRFDPYEIVNNELYDLISAKEFFEEGGYSEEFIHYFFLGRMILLFVGHPASYYLDYPIRLLMKYWMFTGDPDSIWMSRIKGGSAVYINKMIEYLRGQGVEFHLGTQSTLEVRNSLDVTLSFQEKEKSWKQKFDHLILSTQPDISLKLLGEHATHSEREILSRFQITTDPAVLHEDKEYMPKDPKIWGYGGRIVPNRGEPLKNFPFFVTKVTKCNNDLKTPVFVTYAYDRDLKIKDSKTVILRHVKVTPNTLRLRHALERIQGFHKTWFIGSWTRGTTLHENAVVSGLNIANSIMGGSTVYPILGEEDLYLPEKKETFFWNPSQTIVDVLESQASTYSTKQAFIFIDDQGNEAETLTYADLHKKAMNLAKILKDDYQVCKGDRIIITYLPGLDFIVAFFGILFAGAVPVPLAPLKPDQPTDTLEKVIKSCEAHLGLTQTKLLEIYKQQAKAKNGQSLHLSHFA